MPPSTPKETTTKVEPWDGAKPYLLDQYAQFNDLIKNGAPKPWSGPLIADQSQATKDSLSQAEQIARGGNTAVLSSGSNAVNGILNSGINSQAANTLSSLQNGSLGTNPTDAYAKSVMNGGASNAPGSYNLNYSNPALSQASGYGTYNNAASGLQSAQANQLANSSNPAASSYLQQTASGANILANPLLNQNIANQQASIADQLKNVTTPQIDSQAALAGRTGSGAYASMRNNADATAAKAMSEVATNALTNQYNQDVAAQQNAANLYGNLYNQDVNNRLNANQQLAATDAQQQQLRQAGTSLYGSLSDSQNAAQLANSNAANAQFNQNNAFQMQGAQMASNNYQNNIANMLGLNGQKLNAANSQIAADSNLNGQKLSAASQAAQQYQNQYLPSQALSGVGTAKDNYNSTVLQSQVDAWNTAQQQPLTNIGNFVNLLNGGGYSNTTQPVYSNTTGQILGGLSSLAGLFSLCDVREKVIHALVGYMPLTNGDKIAMYEFSYRDDPDAIVWTGPIAQEVEEKTGAVIEFAGRKIVDVSGLMKEAA
ncbi:hypothetical protein [Neorhizobium sp. NCHU2750]|uniref:hypothetical protein n=1 Tax=Neorhizobium sp. NCHU2750 TaxID=1825976 RepID=UPI000EB75A99|nr:hypothetical protein NCHU2750_23570 [Neorhizobium sp. NCHU2750]